MQRRPQFVGDATEKRVRLLRGSPQATTHLDMNKLLALSASIMRLFRTAERIITPVRKTTE